MKTHLTNKIDCTNFMAHQYPKIQAGMYVECYNNSQGVIKTVMLDNYIELESGEQLHKMDIKLLYK